MSVYGSKLYSNLYSANNSVLMSPSFEELVRTLEIKHFHTTMVCPKKAEVKL